LDWLEKVRPAEPLRQDCGYHQFFASVDALVMGRNTYKKVLSFGKWPYEGKRVVVLSNRKNEPKHHVEFYQGDIVQLSQQLYDEGIKHLYIDGGITIAQFLQAKLVDEMILTIIPILLGKGIRLFNPITVDTNCQLLRSEIYSTGIVQLHYALVKA
jgi:dihydrofolate reductase